MPDVKPPQPYNYPPTSFVTASAGSPAGCTSLHLILDMEPCIANLPLSPDLSTLPQHRPSGPHYPGLQGPPFPLMARCNSSTLLTNLGLRYCTNRQGPVSVWPGQGPDLGSCIHTGSNGSRPYRSMENLNWNTRTYSGMYGLSADPHRDVDSELILQYTSTSQWCGEAPDGSVVGSRGLVPTSESLVFYPRCRMPKKDLLLFPQVLFPSGTDEWEARKGLRDKLRLQSARSSVEPLKTHPLRPQETPGAAPTEREDMHHGSSTAAGSKTLCTMRMTTPEDIKQEVLRRLQLRRQNSSPNLALHSSSSNPRVVKTSYTTDNIAGNNNQSHAAPEHCRDPVGHLHIPTFEEFKRMRQKGGEQSNGSTASSGESKTLKEGETPDSNTCPSHKTVSQLHSGGGTREQQETMEEVKITGSSGEALQTNTSSYRPPINTMCSTTTAGPTSSSISMTSTFSPIRTGPSPRPPLQAPASSAQSKVSAECGDDGSNRRRSSSLEPAVSVPFPPENWERPSSCCPTLLLEGTDLSSYGAKIYRMKDGLIGSAMDLIKKSCSAENSAKTPIRLSGDQDECADITGPSTGCQPSAVAMATSTTVCKAEAGDETPAEGWQHSSLGCRRSSSDAAYELAETVRVQRECRLRPHYSDPMPADASKRKQLEMKIAAAARLHSHRRDRDRDRDRDSAPAALRGRSEPPGEERQVGLGVIWSGQHRWSTISSLSADSGVVGLSDEREEEDSEPRRYHRTPGAEVERVDSGIGPGLSRTWKRPSATLRAWEAQRPCPDCGMRDGAPKEPGERTCEHCSKLRTERKEAILEFLNTESSYGEDLRIIKEEFYSPMQKAGLLTAEQLTVVFANVQELIDVNDRFTEHLQDSIDHAFDQGDGDLLTVYIGEIFLEFVNMLPAFQTYCLQQSTSVNMLNMLEKEKELLRIFLDVSQNDNTALRRMNLRSFLMAPLQRVTKYPLLLSRIIKVTHECHPDYARLREAKSRVESHLEHINMKTKQEGNGVSWSLRSFRRDSRKNREVINIEMREVSMKMVGWTRENTQFIMEGPLQLSQPADGQWLRKGSKTFKFQNVQTLLMVRTQGAGEAPAQGFDPRARGDQGVGSWDCIQDGVLILIKDKSSGKFTVLREPIHLGNCVVSTDPDSEDTFEVLDIRRESFIFRASDKSRTQQWLHQIKRYARDLGGWKKRRNALPNIMINTNQSRS